MTADQGPFVGLKEAERRLRLLGAVVIFNVVLCSSYQDALFLAYHKRQAIPMAMLIGSLLTALTTLGLNFLLRKRPAAGALRIILLVLGLLTFGAGLWNLAPGETSTFVLFLFIEVATTLGVAATWTYFQAPLEAAQIRWLLPRLGAWAGVGGLIAGTTIPLMLRNLPIKPHYLILPSAFAWLAASMLVRSNYAAKTPAKRRQSSSGQQSNLRMLMGIPLVRWMTIGSGGIIWTGLLIQYESRVALQQAQWGPQEIAQVMCILLAVSNIGGIATQALVTTPVLEHFGVGLALAILPAALMLFLGGYVYSISYEHMAPTITVWIVIGALLLDKMLRPNLHRPAESCLVAALSPAIRPSLLLVLGGILAPLIKAVGALALWAFATNADPTWVTLSALVFATGVTILSTRWGSLYARTLRETLEDGSVDAVGVTDGTEDIIPMIDGPRLRVLMEAIDSGSPRSRELALELLRSHRSNLVQKAMQARIRHPFEPVRIAALRWLSEEPNPELETHLKQRWAERNISDRERVALLEAAASLGPLLLGQETQRWLSVTDPALRSAVIKSLLSASDTEQRDLGRRSLEGMINSRDPDDVVAALRLIHEHKVADFLPSVLARLQDGELLIRREAVNCLAVFDDDRARKPLWAALSEPKLAHVAVRALTTVGESLIPAILVRLADAETPSMVRMHLLRALGMIPSTAGIQVLIEHLGHTDRLAQLEALRSLNRLHRGNESIPMDQPRLLDYLMGELRWGLHMMRARDFLRDHLRQGGLLFRELLAQISSTQQRVALCLSLLAPKDTMVYIFKALRSPNSPHRDQARELLRATFKPGPLVSASLKLLDDSMPWSPEFSLAPLSVHIGPSPESAVDWLRQSGDPWILSAILHDPDCPKAGTSISESHDPVLPYIDLVQFLKDVSLFEALTNPQLVEVARVAEKVDLPAETLLFHQGDPPDYLYLVRKGKLRVLVGDQEVARFGPGECVGEMAVLASTRRTAGVDTLEPCQLLRFAEADFLGLVDSYPEVGRALLKSLVHRLAQTGRPKDKPRASTIIGMVWGKDGPEEASRRSTEHSASGRSDALFPSGRSKTDN